MNYLINLVSQNSIIHIPFEIRKIDEVARILIGLIVSCRIEQTEYWNYCIYSLSVFHFVGIFRYELRFMPMLWYEIPQQLQLSAVHQKNTSIRIGLAYSACPLVQKIHHSTIFSKF